MLRNVRDAAAILQIGLDSLVFCVPLIEPVRQAVFVGREAAARLQDPERFGVDAGNVRRAADRLDGIDRVVTGVRRVDVDEVALEEIKQMA